MKRKQQTSETASNSTADQNPCPKEPSVDEDDEASGEPILTSGADVCKALTHRYAKSKAPQHRHLIATAAAMKFILLEEGLPLTPPAYFAAAITAFRDSAGRSDPDSIAAVSSLLSFLVDSVVLPPPKAKDAAFVLADFLKLGQRCSLATGTVRSLIKSLGMLVLLVDLEDWDSVELPLQALLAYAVDKRPKVRKCAQVCVENVFKAFHSPIVIENGSRFVLSMYRKYRPSLESEHLETLHMLNVLTVVVPNLSEKVRMKIMCDAYKLLGCSFSSCTAHILRLLEALVEYLKVEDLVSDSEHIFSALASYISTENNPIDTVISASILLKNGLKKLHDAQPSLWIKFLPAIVTSVAGYLTSNANPSKHPEDILIELINTHIDQKLFSASTLCNSENYTLEVMTITSICTVFDQMLGACDIPAENILAVLSVLFLRLGEFSYFFMKEIFLKLSRKTTDLKEESPNMKHLQSCIGSAIIAMGPEKVLSLMPISLDTEKLICSNTWMLPILKKYMMGASLEYFMEHIVPLAESVKNICKKVKKPSRLKGLQLCFHGLWDLLPAFCRFPTDTSKSFGVLSKLLIATLEESPSLHETIANAVQELVKGNVSFMKTNRPAKPYVDLPSSFILNDSEASSLLFCYSEKTASRNRKALACSSMDLFQVFTDIFLDSPPENHSFLKEAIGCLSSVLGSEKIKYFFVSSLEKCESRDALIESSKLEDEIPENDMKEGVEKASKSKECRSRRCLMLELASCFVGTADEDLTNIIFSYIKSYLSDIDGNCQTEAYYTLSRILEVHNWFCEARIDELMDLLFNVKISVDHATIKNRFSCLHHLLVHILKRNDEDVNNKAFLILNDIIVTLKTKKESRKLAYNILLNISCTLKDTQSTDKESGLQRLLNMVMGYLSSSSPHITSGAISALSLLIHNDARFCIAVPNLIPSVLTLLANKDVEVIKAALGFIKVLASSLYSNDLLKFLSDILNGMLPWSSVSKHHFRSKVGIILEILIRKCGIDAVGVIVPGKYRSFVRTIEEGRQWKKNSGGLSNSDTARGSADSAKNGGEKRALEGPSRKCLKDNSKNFHNGNRWKQQDDASGANNKKTGGKGGRSQSPKGVVSAISENLFKIQLKGRNKKRKRNVDEKPNIGNKRKQNKREKDDSNKNLDHASVASKPGGPSKFNKNRWKLGNRGP